MNFATVFNPNGGVFVYVPSEHVPEIAFDARIVDLSRESLTWGTEIPVISESGAYTTSIRLIGIPTDPRFRLMLRIYDFDGVDGVQVRVRVFTEADVILADQTLAMRKPAGDQPFPFAGYPATVQVDLTGLVAGSTGRARVEIDPITPGLRFWAFVSVTHDETQHVTLITPH
ncbi:MAG TPA: hypothetical protein VEZ11_16410 [Thermoanaerobaculia bacterium]|nr:hypothetical protein [Thermoanaerobaculia bacterium]